MFDNSNGQQATMGATSTQNPSMLDNVPAQDFTTDDTQASATTPQTDISSSPTTDNTATTASTPQPITPPPAPDTTPTIVSSTPTPAPVTETNDEPKPEPEHLITSDNPFIQSPAPLPVTDDDSDSSSADPVSSDPPTTIIMPETASKEEEEEDEDDDDTPISTSGPVQPPSLPKSPDDEAKDETNKKEGSTKTKETEKEEPEDSNDTSSSVPEVDTKKLAGMKQQALGHLEPLVEHLDQNPEETFKTTMMMIQANDNHTLLEKALNAAKQIEDDKARAQAMLDIVNEINYFSQLPSQDEE